MKKLIPFLLILFAYSCKKETTNQKPVVIVDPLYIGTYNSIDGDTAYVEKGNGTYTQIRWAALGATTAKIVFDSVVVAENQSLTDNEIVWYFEPSTSIGTGYFNNNTLVFKFTLGRGGDVIFNGVKR